jgi:hypothetical protein
LETATDFRDFRDLNWTDELLSAVSLRDQEGSGGTSWQHPGNIKNDRLVMETWARHGKTTIDAKSNHVRPAISMFLSNAVGGDLAPALKISFDNTRECELIHSNKSKKTADHFLCTREHPNRPQRPRSHFCVTAACSSTFAAN